MPRRVMKRVKFVKLTKIKKIGCVLIKQFSCVNEILGGVRSTCTNVGASRAKELPKRTTFIRCTQQLNPVFNQMKQVTKRAAEAYGMDGKSKKQKN